MIPKFITKHPNTKYIRYVDDCFIITTSEEENNLLFLELNEAHQSIKFTKESETSNQLAFLDVLIVKKMENSQLKYTESLPSTTTT